MKGELNAAILYVFFLNLQLNTVNPLIQCLYRTQVLSHKPKA